MEKQSMYMVLIVAVVALVGFFMMFNRVSLSPANDLTGLPVAVTCTDSDGGLSFNTFGTVTRGSGTYTDVCNTGTVLKERYCTTTGYVNTQMYNCAAVGKVCQNGACVATSGTCTDSDGGNNVNVAGTATGPMSSNGPVQTNTDQCYNIYTDDGSGETTSSCTPSSANGIICQVREYYCNNGVVAINDQQLPATQGCTNGAVVALQPDLVPQPGTVFLTGQAYVVNGQVQVGSLSVDYTCPILNQGTAPATATLSLGNQCALLGSSPTISAQVAFVLFVPLQNFILLAGDTYNMIGTEGWMSNVYSRALLQSLYNTGSASAYLFITTDVNNNIVESNNGNNINTFPLTITPAMYKIDFINTIACTQSSQCSANQVCQNNICV